MGLRPRPLRGVPVRPPLLRARRRRHQLLLPPRDRRRARPRGLLRRAPRGGSVLAPLPRVAVPRRQPVPRRAPGGGPAAAEPPHPRPLRERLHGLHPGVPVHRRLRAAGALPLPQRLLRRGAAAAGAPGRPDAAGAAAQRAGGAPAEAGRDALARPPRRERQRAVGLAARRAGDAAAVALVRRGPQQLLLRATERRGAGRAPRGAGAGPHGQRGVRRGPGRRVCAPCAAAAAPGLQPARRRPGGSRRRILQPARGAGPERQQARRAAAGLPWRNAAARGGRARQEPVHRRHSRTVRRPCRGRGGHGAVGAVRQADAARQLSLWSPAETAEAAQGGRQRGGELGGQLPAEVPTQVLLLPRGPAEGPRHVSQVRHFDTS